MKLERHDFRSHYEETNITRKVNLPVKDT